MELSFFVPSALLVKLVQPRLIVIGLVMVWGIYRSTTVVHGCSPMSRKSLPIFSNYTGVARRTRWLTCLASEEKDFGHSSGLRIALVSKVPRIRDLIRKVGECLVLLSLL
jgi:hypothetical protein